MKERWGEGGTKVKAIKVGEAVVGAREAAEEEHGVSYYQGAV